MLNNALIRITSATARLAQQRVLYQYRNVATKHPETQNPVIIIPGILGSSLVHQPSGRSVWGGESKLDFADPTDPEQLRYVCLPLRGHDDTPIPQSEVLPSGVVYQLNAKVLGFPLAVKAYGPILEMFGVTGFLQSRCASTFDPKSGIETEESPLCFEFDYDWRQSIPENAKRLGEFIRSVREFAGEIGHSGRDGTSRVDVVAHSMGGLLLRYYLRYGEQGMPEDGTPPTLDWSGGEHVDRTLFVGVPNGGSVHAADKLIRGISESAASPAYSAAVLGTMPSVYQLLPRTRHECVLAAEGEAAPDLFDPEIWRRHGWGLLGEDADDELKMLLPELETRKERLERATLHLDYCLTEAKRVHEALDSEAEPPPNIRKHLFAGDGVMTARRILVSENKNISVVAYDHGDGTVLRSSTLMDERVKGRDESMLVSPIKWASVTFIPTDHMMLTCHPTFINNALFQILEDPTPQPVGGKAKRFARTAVAASRATVRGFKHPIY